MTETGSAGQTSPSSETEIDLHSDDTVPGSRRRTGRGHIDSYGMGRVCEAPECTTELSRYNSSGACWLHDKQRFLLVAAWTR